MKFTNARPFRPDRYETDISSVQRYLANVLPHFFRDLLVGLTKLSFSDNFDSFKTSATVPASSELAIRHSLGKTPTEKIILRDGGSNSIVDGDTAWDSDYVYLKNLSGSDVTVTVVFLV